MSTRRPSPLDKAIKALDDKITALALAREELVQQRSAADLAVAKRPTLKTVTK